MRRPLLIIFTLIICVTFIYTNIIYLDESYDNDIVIIEGLVKLEVEKREYNEYKVGKFIVRDYSKKNILKVGQMVEVKGKFKNLSKMKYDDFDYGRYIRSIGCKGIIYIENYKFIGNNKLYAELFNIKIYIRNTLRYLYKYNSDFLNSLLIGEKENLKQEEKEMFAKTGTSHVIAISGLHTGILCTLIAFIMGNINRVYKLIILFIIIFLYNLMIGGSPSILRSIAFVVTSYLSIFIDKKEMEYQFYH